MVEATETLIKLLSQTSSGRGKSNKKVESFNYERTSTPANYRFRVNRVAVASTIPTGGSTVRVQLPAYKAITGECMLKLTVNAASQGTIDPYFGAKVLKSLKLRHSDVCYTIEDVPEVWAYLFSKMPDAVQKAERKTIFGASAAGAAEQTVLIPLLQPWSVWVSPQMYKTAPPRHGQRSCLFRTDLLRENVVFELEFANVTDFSDAAQGVQIKDVELLFEELVAEPAVMEQLKQQLPRAVCAPEFTSQTLNTTGAEQDIDITALLSRAPTHSLGFYVKKTAGATRDPFDIEEKLDLSEIEADGRRIVSNRGHSAAERQMRDILEGRVGTGRSAPNMPLISFDNGGQYAMSHAVQQLSNTSCNSVTCRISAAAGTGKILAVHERLFMIDQTIKNRNIY